MRKSNLYPICTLLAMLAISSCKTASPDYTQLLQSYRHSVHHNEGTSTFYISEATPNAKKSSASHYYWYSKNQVHQTTGGYHGKLLNGEFAQHDKDGHLREKGTFTGGLKTSLWKTWDDNGLLITEEYYQRGELQWTKSYGDKGMLPKTAHYKKGQLHGPSTTFLTPDSSTTEHYRNGKKVLRIPITKKITRLWKRKKR